jgi:hypothetical protein
MYEDYVTIQAIAREVREDLDAHEISGNDRALDRLEALLDRIDPEGRQSR